MPVVCVLIAVVSALASPPAPVHDPPRTVRIADGIYVFITPPYGDVGLDGNSIAIVSTDGVLVFDSNGTPAAAEAVLAEIRRLTDKPVTLPRELALALGSLVRIRGVCPGLSRCPGHQPGEHARDDGGARAGIQPPRPRDAASRLPRVAREKSRCRRARDATARRPRPAEGAPRRGSVLPRAEKGRAPRLPQHDVCGSADAPHGRPRDPGAALRSRGHAGRCIPVSPEGKGPRHRRSPRESGVVCVGLLSDRLAADVRADGRARRVGASCPATASRCTTRRCCARTWPSCASCCEAAPTPGTRGLDPDQAKAEVLPRLHDQMVAITGDDPAANDAFRVYLVDWYLHRVFDELSGPLTDAIAPIPAKEPLPL